MNRSRVPPLLLSELRGRPTSDSSSTWLLATGYWLLPISRSTVILHSVPLDVPPIFQEEYRAPRPRAPRPPIHVRFRRFTSLNTTIRLREGEIFVSLSDLLEGAPESVLHAIAHILLAKLYKKPI